MALNGLPPPIPAGEQREVFALKVNVKSQAPSLAQKTEER